MCTSSPIKFLALVRAAIVQILCAHLPPCDFSSSVNLSCLGHNQESPTDVKHELEYLDAKSIIAYAHDQSNKKYFVYGVWYTAGLSREMHYFLLLGWFSSPSSPSFAVTMFSTACLL